MLRNAGFDDTPLPGRRSYPLGLRSGGPWRTPCALECNRDILPQGGRSSYRRIECFQLSSSRSAASRYSPGSPSNLGGGRMLRRASEQEHGEFVGEEAEEQRGIDLSAGSQYIGKHQSPHLQEGNLILQGHVRGPTAPRRSPRRRRGRRRRRGQWR
jgi:hypothetical protein